jgi:hypothetical protein
MVFYCFLLARYDKFKSLKKSEKSGMWSSRSRKKIRKKESVRKETMVFDANTGKIFIQGLGSIITGLIGLSREREKKNNIL